jgi:arginyl-tRNA--protein-N-Asp/Glu arginylyltransferase
LDKLYDHYNNNGEISSRVHNGSDSSTTIDENESSDNSFHFMSKFQKYRASKSDVESKSELDWHLMEDIEKMNVNFDILNWWKVNSTKFEVIAQIAQDVLAILITTVASESVFSTRGRVLDHFRSSLAPTTVEALTCSHNWLRSKQ